MAAKNPCAKTVTPENAYEVWQIENHPTYGGKWTWFVLKKYQIPAHEATNPTARWHCLVTSPYVSERGELGDVYVLDILETGAKQIPNPITHQDEQTTGGTSEIHST